MASQHLEELVEAVRANLIIREVDIGSALLDIGEVVDDQGHLLIQPVAKPKQVSIVHGRVATLQLDVHLPLAHDDTAFVPGQRLVQAVLVQELTFWNLCQVVRGSGSCIFGGLLQPAGCPGLCCLGLGSRRNLEDFSQLLQRQRCWLS